MQANLGLTQPTAFENRRKSFTSQAKIVRRCRWLLQSFFYWRNIFHSLGVMGKEIFYLLSLFLLTSSFLSLLGD
uniref:Uncharacterized protein n=1 Tax=Anopheles christyi TaxID=43041 RepID=A0A182KHW3_9DIPT